MDEEIIDFTKNVETQSDESQQINRLQSEINTLERELKFGKTFKYLVIGGAAGYFFGKKMSPTIGLLSAIGGAYMGSKLGQKGENSKDQTELIREQINARKEVIKNLKFQTGIEQNGILGAKDIVDHEYEHYNFTGKWLDFIGNPSVPFHAIVFGKPKHGKSIFSMQFAKYLSESHGTVLYIATEEGFGATLKQKIVDFGLSDNDNLQFANYRDKESIAQICYKYDFIIIDSINYSRLEVEDIEALKDNAKRTSFITVHQSTKEGDFRGSQEFAHNCDVVIQVDSGTAKGMGRFAGQAMYSIFEDSPAYPPPPNPEP